MVMVYGNSVLFVVQVLNRDKLQRAGEDNLFVRLLYAKDKAQTPKNQDEQEKLGMPTDLPPQPLVCPLPYNLTDLLTLANSPTLTDLPARRMNSRQTFASGPILRYARNTVKGCS